MLVDFLPYMQKSDFFPSSCPCHIFTVKLVFQGQALLALAVSVSLVSQSEEKTNQTSETSSVSEQIQNRMLMLAQKPNHHNRRYEAG